MRKLILFALVLSAIALAQPAPQPRSFLFKLEPARKDFTLQNMTDAERPVLMQHAAYLKSLTDSGKLTLAGQAFDPAGFWGIVIVTAPDAQAAAEMMNADPAVASKLFRGSVIPFRVVFTARPVPAQ